MLVRRRRHWKDESGRERIRWEKRENLRACVRLHWECAARQAKNGKRQLGSSFIMKDRRGMDMKGWREEEEEEGSHICMHM